jgi:hypothetical protein
MRGHAKDTLLFIAIAVIMMALVDYFFMGGREAYRTITPQESATLSQSEPAPVYIPDPEPVLPPETGIDTSVESDTVILPDDFGVFDFFNDELLWEERESRVVPDDPPPDRAAPPMVREISSRPRIAIIIDDIGMNVRWSKAAVQLPGPLTMAVLPYAAQAAHFADLSRANGHELLIHTPMEAMNAPVSLGGMGLTTDMDTEDIVATMDKISATMNGYIGINNHMGSKFTADRAAMERLIPYLKKHNMIFVDSKTIGTSVAAMVADEQGIPYAVRDVFLDHEETPEFVAAAIRRLETIALRDGHAIAIGHPKAATITALQTWIPTLRDKGIDLVGISKLVLRPSTIAPALVSPAPEQAPVPQSLEQPSPY